MEDYGNTVSSTIPIALKKNKMDSGKAENRILLAGFGVGYWGAVAHITLNDYRFLQ
jgi:3-oxoacyl-[acyl-carrier-protein] synthase-3